MTTMTAAIATAATTQTIQRITPPSAYISPSRRRLHVSTAARVRVHLFLRGAGEQRESLDGARPFVVCQPGDEGFDARGVEHRAGLAHADTCRGQPDVHPTAILGV